MSSTDRSFRVAEKPRRSRRAIASANASIVARSSGRKLATFIRKRKAADYQAQRRSIFELYIEEVAGAIGKITRRKPGPIKREFLQVAHKVTAAEMKEEEKALELEAREAKQKARARAEETE